MEKTMKVIYIGHSGFYVETEQVCMLFDCIADGQGVENHKPYDTGMLPELPETKPLIVFASHKHQDHYDPCIWKLRKRHPNVFYVLGYDICFSMEERRCLGLTGEDLDRVLWAQANREYELPEYQMKVETLKSTDEGVAFYVTVDGHTIYHAGDLHAWYWEEEGMAYVEEMKQAFEKELVYLKGRRTDAAFLLLDPRMQTNAYAGMDRYLETMQAEHVFPMHLWKQYDFIERYKQDRKDAPYSRTIERIREPGQIFRI